MASWYLESARLAEGNNDCNVIIFHQTATAELSHYESWSYHTAAYGAGRIVPVRS